jgi:hypothetical protein
MGRMETDVIVCGFDLGHQIQYAQAKCSSTPYEERLQS